MDVMDDDSELDNNTLSEEELKELIAELPNILRELEAAEKQSELH